MPNKLTSSLIVVIVVLLGILFFTSSTIQSLSVEVGSMKVELKKATSEAETQRKLYLKERDATAIMKQKNDILEKEIIDEKIKFERAFSGTTTIG